MRRRMCLLLAPMAVTVGAGAFSALAQEDPTNIVADQIRAQGYKCDSPQGATRDPQASRPDEQVWLLQCESGSFRVRLHRSSRRTLISKLTEANMATAT